MTLLLSCLFLMLGSVFFSHSAPEAQPSPIEQAKEGWLKVASSGNGEEIQSMKKEMSETLTQAWANYMQAQLSAGLLKNEYQPDPEHLAKKLVEHHRDNPNQLISDVCTQWKDILDRTTQVQPNAHY